MLDDARAGGEEDVDAFLESLNAPINPRQAKVEKNIGLYLKGM